MTSTGPVAVARTALAAASALAALRHAMRTRAPCFAITLAAARPRPELDPVMTAVLPSSAGMSFSVHTVDADQIFDVYRTWMSVNASRPHGPFSTPRPLHLK